MVATPIGNLGDITLRAAEVLRGADLVACEDTRVTGKLMHHLGARARLVRYDEHAADKTRPLLLEKLRAGAAVALVSDAGTPLISDPGYRLVRSCREEGIAVQSLPGASAVLTALTLSGLPTDRFLFAGFLPNKTAARRKAAAGLTGLQATLVFYESPKRLAACLADLADTLGPVREAAVARELTKLYEEVRAAPLAELAAHYAETGPPKGEVVIVVGPPPAETPPGEEDVDVLLRAALVDHRVKDAAALVAEKTGLGKSELYARAQAIKDAAKDGEHDD